ncbi:MAG: hypothetical protein HYS09_04215 [Chloroflexi bacterium]|nr:hypothetical protein [Chloroflexota bacterium]
MTKIAVSASGDPFAFLTPQPTSTSTRTATSTPTATATPTPTPTATPSPTPAPTATPAPTPCPTATTTPTATPTATPTHQGDAAIIRINAPQSIFGQTKPDTKDIHVRIQNQSDHTETIGVYMDITAPSGCTPNGRIMQTSVTLSPGQRTNVFTTQVFDCVNQASAAGQRYTLVAVADVHNDDLASCPPGSLQGLACFNALADDDTDDSDNRKTRTCCHVPPP